MTGDVLAQIEAVLQNIAERTKHTEDCATTYMRWRCACGEKSEYSNACGCDRGARVLQDQARTVERIGQVMASYDDEGMSTHERSDAAEEAWWTKRWAAALRATEQGET